MNILKRLSHVEVNSYVGSALTAVSSIQSDLLILVIDEQIFLRFLKQSDFVRLQSFLLMSCIHL